MEIIDEVMTFIGWMFTIISVMSSIWFYIRKRKGISWRGVKRGIKELAKKVEQIKPDYIITFSGRGAIVCSLTVTELDNKYPGYMCLLK